MLFSPYFFKCTEQCDCLVSGYRSDLEEAPEWSCVRWQQPTQGSGWSGCTPSSSWPLWRSLYWRNASGPSCSPPAAEASCSSQTLVSQPTCIICRGSPRGSQEGWITWIELITQLTNMKLRSFFHYYASHREAIVQIRVLYLHQLANQKKRRESLLTELRS